MNEVDIVVKQQVDSNIISCTGTTVNYGSYRAHYVVTSIFQRQNGLVSKTLERYRDLIEVNMPEDVKLYFINLDGKYWYSNKILEFRKYNKHRNKPVIVATQPLSRFEIKSFRQGLNQWILSQNWDYKCGAGYKTFVSADGCTAKMQILFDRISKRFPAATISIFYTTERNPGRDGYHNHFLVSVNGKALKNFKRTLVQMIRSIGCDVPECESYQLTMGNLFIKYATKFVDDNPDRWFILTNKDVDQCEPN